ncbi:MAG: glycosyltransferase family 4 protein [Candidatus Competibacterales bacterium]|nr:glycosyltransferase family 4 protein [Candidatus Competibacterales bacterium]
MSDSSRALARGFGWFWLRTRLGRFPLLFKHLGWWGALRYLLRRLSGRGRSAEATSVQPGNDVFAFYRFITAAAPPQTPAGSIRKGTMNWVVPHFEIGSGGHTTAFRMIRHLERLGYTCRVVLTGPTSYTRSGEVRRLIRRHFMPLEAEVVLGESGLRPAEFTVATSWETAYPVRRFAATHHKLYFIQDFEPHFYAHGSSYAFAEATYRFGFTAITAGEWLARLMRERYGLDAYPFGFSYDKASHRPLARQASGPRRVFFYARNVTPRRGFELGLLALGLVHERLPDVEFVLAGWDTSDYRIPFAHFSAGVVAPQRLVELYSQCDAGLVLSLTNLSLLPLELMACGCPVVSNRGPNVEWQLQHETNALLAETTPEALAAALVRMLEDDDLRARLRHNGLAFARATDWETEARRIHQHLQRIRAAA